MPKRSRSTGIAFTTRTGHASRAHGGTKKLEEAIKPVIKAAQERYRTASKKDTSPVTQAPPPGTGQKPGGAPGATTSGDPRSAEPGKRWTVDEIEAELQSIARSDEKPVLAKVFTRFRNNLRTKGTV